MKTKHYPTCPSHTDNYDVPTSEKKVKHTPLEGLELPPEHAQEYDAAAEWCARRGIAGNPGDRLPENMNPEGALKYINDDPEAFQMRVKQCFYAQYMEARGEQREILSAESIQLAEAASPRGDSSDSEWKLTNAKRFNSLLTKLKG